MDKVFAVEKLNSDFDLPYGIELVDEKVQFCIPNYEDKYNYLDIIARHTAEQEVDIKNVAKIEHEAADIKKMAEAIKKSANSFVATYTEKLLGKGKGKTKVNGQVDELYNMLMAHYNTIHEKTVAVRILAKGETEQEPKVEFTKFTVKVPKEMERQFAAYCLNLGLTYEVK